MPDELRLTALPGLPLLQPGDDLAAILAAALEAPALRPQDGDILAVAQKVVSKAEGRYADLAKVEPSSQALGLAKTTGKDPRLVELVLRESRAVRRAAPNVLLVEHRLGFVHANAGIDRSNLEPGAPPTWVLLLPEDPDRSAAQLRERLQARFGCRLGVLINDSSGRAFRNGVAGIAIGCAGFAALDDRVGDLDLTGRPLEVTEVAVADELAAAASFLMGQGAQGRPAVLIRGAGLPAAEGRATALVRSQERDLFR